MLRGLNSYECLQVAGSKQKVQQQRMNGPQGGDWKLERGTTKSPREVDRRRVSRHGSQSSVRYNGAAPWTTYIKQHSLYLGIKTEFTVQLNTKVTDIGFFQLVHHQVSVLSCQPD